MKDDVVYLRHIAESIRRVEENTRAGRDAFFSSHTLQDAVLRNLQTLAESAQRLSAEAKAEQSGVEWRAISGFRNVLVHNYLGLDLEQVDRRRARCSVTERSGRGHAITPRVLTIA